jgi:hypothetical protein
MRGTTTRQPDRVAIVPSPLLNEELANSVNVMPISVVIAKLADLRSRYLSELVAARDKAKKNFLS